MNYKVFNMKDKETWPELNCPLLVFLEGCEWPFVWQWDKENSCFVDNNLAYYPERCFYKYIGYMPYIERELHPSKCIYHGMCGYEDDGYCLMDIKCEHKKKITEYSLGSKAIWKEFE